MEGDACSEQVIKVVILQDQSGWDHCQQTHWEVALEVPVLCVRNIGVGADRLQIGVDWRL